MEVKIVLAPETTEGLKVFLTCDYGEDMRKVLKKLMCCAAVTDNDALLMFKAIYDKWMYSDDDEDADTDAFSYNITPDELSKLMTDSANLLSELLDQLVDAQLEASVKRLEHPLLY